jgi:molybdopterin synthase sulfur carrier subunit
MIRVVLPVHLRGLAGVGREVELRVDGNATLESMLDALEKNYPMLGGTIRDYTTRQRRPFIRFFACGRDISLEPVDLLLPDAIAAGAEPLFIVGAMAGG